jgi:phospholipid/cholesterol/gamma-HCH transport system ATP-binding protein
MAEEIVRMEGVAVMSGGYEVIKETSLGFEEGKVGLVIGPAGAGKSTFLKLAAGLVLPDRGKVLFRGKDLNAMNEAESLGFRKEAAFAFQDAALWANMSVLDNMLLPLKTQRPELTAEDMEMMIELQLTLLGYEESTKLRPAELSSGEQKLVSIARTLVCGPRLIFFDEPFSGLDDRASARLFRLMKRLKIEGRTLIIASHSRRLAKDIGDYVVVLSQGRVVRSLPMSEALTSGDTLVRSLLDD